MTQATHPVWKLLRLVVVLGFLTLILWLNASNFDETELKVLAWMVVAILTIEFAPNTFEKLKKIVGQDD